MHTLTHPVMPFDTKRGAFTRQKTRRRFFVVSTLLLLSFVSVFFTVFAPDSTQIEFQRKTSFPLPLPKLATHKEQATARIIPACEIWPGWRRTIPQPIPLSHDHITRPNVGSPEFFGGSDEHACVPASERLRPFGRTGRLESQSSSLDYDAREVLHAANTPDWSSLHWGELQSSCAAAHHKSLAGSHAILNRRLERPPPHLKYNSTDFIDNDQGERRTGRTAVVLRAWDKFEYTEHQKAWLRLLIAELAMDTGGEYQVFLMVQVKDGELDLLGDEDLYQRKLVELVPAEFRDMTLLFNEPLLKHWYPLVGLYDVHEQMYQPLQIFSHSFPEFDHVWQIEMDIRLTGNVASMLTTAGRWAAEQPRRNLWERNAQFYIPELWNNSYAAFSAAVDNEMRDEGIWGPAPRASLFVNPGGPTPPPRSYTGWGVGEPADLLTLAPIIDPVGTGWSYEWTAHHWEQRTSRGVTAPDGALPRRMAIISVARSSRRLLRLLSEAQRTKGSWVVTEGTAETVAYLHGLKAVYVPHYVSFVPKGAGQHGPDGLGSSAMSATELDDMLHRGPAWSRAGGEHASFLYCPKATDSPDPRWLDASYFYWAGEAQNMWWEYNNGTCGPPVVLHPIKSD